MMPNIAYRLLYQILSHLVFPSDFYLCQFISLSAAGFNKSFNIVAEELSG